MVMRAALLLSAAAGALAGTLAPSVAMFEAAEDVLSGWQKPNLDVSTEMIKFREAGGVVCWNGDCEAAASEIADGLSQLEWYDSHILPEGFFTNPMSKETVLVMKVYEAGGMAGTVATHQVLAYLSFDKDLKPSVASFFYGPQSTAFLELTGADGMAASVVMSTDFTANVKRAAAAFQYLWYPVHEREEMMKMVSDPSHPFHDMKVCTGITPDLCTVSYEAYFSGLASFTDYVKVELDEPIFFGPYAYFTWKALDRCGSKWQTFSGTVMLKFEGDEAVPKTALFLQTEKTGRFQETCVKDDSSEEL